MGWNYLALSQGKGYTNNMTTTQSTSEISFYDQADKDAEISRLRGLVTEYTDKGHAVSAQGATDRLITVLGIAPQH